MISSSMPTARWRKAPSRSSKCKATSTRQIAPAAMCACRSSATTLCRRSSKGRADFRNGSMRHSGAEDIGTYALALDGEKQPCRCARRMPGKCCSPESHCRSRAHRAADAARRVFSGWGIRTVANCGGALQSDVLSQRLDLAARQCADRARSRPLRRAPFRRHIVRSLVERRGLYGPAALAGTVLRLPAPAWARPYPLSGGLLAAGLGGRAILLWRCSPRRWASASIRPIVTSSSTGRTCRIS